MQLTIDISAFSRIGGVVVLLLLGVFLIVGIAGAVRRFFAGRSFDAFDRESMRSRWKEIERMIDQPGEMGAKVAVLEADKLLDHALKSLAMPGMSLADRLKFAAYKYPRLKEVWWAHKVRNQLAHESSYHLDRGVAKKAVAEFRKALEMIGAL